MLKTTTRLCEEYVVKLYKDSKQNDFQMTDKITASELILQIKGAFKVLTSYEGVDHNKNLKTLYFNVNNIINSSITSMALRLYISERTLHRYREKYARVLILILKSHSINFLSDKKWQFPL